MRGYDLSPFVNGKAFIQLDSTKDGKADYGARICINRQGEKLFELPDRDMIVNEFQEEDIAFVYGNSGLYAVMNNKGEFLTDFIYKHIYGGSEEGLFEVTRNGKHGAIDINGREIIPCMYDNGSHFSEGAAAECLNGKYGMVDTRNEVIIPFEYENICTCKNNIISVQKNGRWGLINKHNEVIIDFLYDEIYNWCTRECLVYPAKKDGKWGLIDRYNNTVEDFIYDEIDIVSDNEDNEGEFIQIIKDKHRAIYSTKKKEFITGFDYTFFGYCTEGRILAHKNGQIGFIDTNGEEVIPFIYDSPIPFGDDEFSEGRAVVYKDGKAGVIDLEGNVIIPFKYKRIHDCREGMIWAVNENRKDGFLNRNGEIVIPFGKYHIESDFNEGFIAAWNEEQGNVYIDKKGNILEIKI